MFSSINFSNNFLDLYKLILQVVISMVWLLALDLPAVVSANAHQFVFYGWQQTSTSSASLLIFMALS